MRDFHIIIWPSLPALFSGEFQFPGKDRYKALRMVPGWLFLDLSWNCSGKKMNSEGISHDLNFYRLELGRYFYGDAWSIPALRLNGLTLNTEALMLEEFIWEIITSMATSQHKININESYELTIMHWTVIAGMPLSNTSHRFLTQDYEPSAAPPLWISLQNIHFAVIHPRILQCYLRDHQGRGLVLLQQGLPGWVWDEAFFWPHFEPLNPVSEGFNFEMTGQGCRLTPHHTQRGRVLSNPQSLCGRCQG